MRNFLLYCNGLGRIVTIPPNTPTEGYAKLENNFLKDAKGTKDDYVYFLDLFEDQKIDNVYYNEELAGSQGVSFWVISLPNNTKDEVEYAKNKLKNDRDVVRMKVFHVDKMI